MLLRIIMLLLVVWVIFCVLIPMIFNGFNMLRSLVWWMFP